MSDSSDMNDHGADQEQSQKEPSHRPFEAFKSAMRQGAEDAKSAAQHAIPKIKAAAIQADYWAAFGLSFAAVFSSTLAKGLISENLKTGCRDGVKAGRTAAETWVERARNPRKSAPIALLDSSLDNTEPGTAS